MNMIDLYRGLNDILVYSGQELKDHFINHIRKFNDGKNEHALGSAGYWNFMLEFVFIFYVKLFVAFGTILTVLMAVLFFPLYAFREFFAVYFNVFKLYREEQIIYKEREK
jgi:hypothetical protein